MSYTLTRTTWTDDSGSGGTGTILNNAVLQAIYDAIDAALADIDDEVTARGVGTDEAFDAGKFTAGGSMTWTVAAGDVDHYRYVKRGKFLRVWFRISTSTIGGTPHSDLYIRVPGGLTVAGYRMKGSLAYSNAAGAWSAAGWCEAINGDTRIVLYKAGQAAWDVGADDTYLNGDIEFEVTT